MAKVKRQVKCQYLQSQSMRTDRISWCVNIFKDVQSYMMLAILYGGKGLESETQNQYPDNEGCANIIAKYVWRLYTKCNSILKQRSFLDAVIKGLKLKWVNNRNKQLSNKQQELEMKQWLVFNILFLVIELLVWLLIILCVWCT